MNLRYAFIAVSVLILVCSGIYYSTGQETRFEKASKILAIREIGHELLLASGDSTSRVLPVTHISDSEYQLRFESSFSFKTDSLVDLTRKIMKASNVSENYIVNVAEAANPEAVTYGFSISEKGKNTVPCLGRTIPVNKYNVNILVGASMIPLPEKGGYSVIFWIAALLIGFSFWKFSSTVSKPFVKEGPINTGVQIGKYSFYPGELLLTIGGSKTILTDKECKLLNIFSNNINNVIDRDRLLKEGWEDEGVITQRSLDVYVSRLRKKLVNDPAVRIRNVHGKGYCLKISIAEI